MGAGIYMSPSGVFRAILHCGCNYKYVWSMDGLHWTSSSPKVPWCNVEFTDGTNATLKRRERPKWLLGVDGQPTHLFTGVQPSEATDPTHGANTFTMAAEILP